MPRLVLRTPNHVGDCVMSLSAVGALRDLFRESHISVLAPEALSGLYKYHPSVDEVIDLKQHHGFASVSAAKGALEQSGGGYEIGILLTDSFSSALGLKLAQVTNIYGYPDNGRTLLLSGSAESTRSIHRSKRYTDLVSYSARKFWANPYWVDEVQFEHPQIFLREVERNAALTTLKSRGINPESGFVAIAPQAVAESRRWGIEKYAELARLIVTELNLRVGLVGAPEEHSAGEDVVRLAGEQVYNLCGATRIRIAIAVLEVARGFVGNDSGVAHLAALAGIPIVVLSGADDPAVTSPLSDHKTVIRRDQLECIACVKNTCPKSGSDHMRCMTEISVQEVFESLRARLS